MRVYPEAALTLLPPPTSLASLSQGWLQEGALYRVRVMEVAPGAVLISLKGRLLEASSTISLEKGQELLVKALSCGPRVILRVLTPEAPSDAEILVPLLRKGLPWLSQRAWRTIEEPFRNIPLRAGSPREPLWSLEERTWMMDVGRLIRASGLFLENKLLRIAQGEEVQLWPDNKAHLLRLVAATEGPGEPREAAIRLLSSIEALQALASLRGEGGGVALVVPLLPWALPYGVGGWIRFWRPPVSRQDPRGSHWMVTVDLEGEAMGRVRARILLERETLKCVIWASLPHVRNWIRTHMGELIEMLSGCGAKGVHCCLETTTGDPEGLGELLEGLEGIVEVTA